MRFARSTLASALLVAVATAPPIHATAEEPPRSARATRPGAPIDEQPRRDAEPKSDFTVVDGRRARLELQGAALAIAGAAVFGGGVGLAVWSQATNDQQQHAAAPNPRVSGAATALGSAAIVVSVVGIVAGFVGGGLMRLSRRRDRVALDVAVSPARGGVQASLGFRL